MSGQLAHVPTHGQVGEDGIDWPDLSLSATREATPAATWAKGAEA